MVALHDFEKQPLNPLIFELLNEGREGRGEVPFHIYARDLIFVSADPPSQKTGHLSHVDGTQPDSGLATIVFLA